MIGALVDQLNAEIEMASVNTLNEAVNWFGYTYLYIRMMRNPLLYNIT